MAQVDRKLLHPEFLKQLLVLVELVRQEGLPMRMTCGYRSVAEQNALYAQGRARPGRKVTGAKGGQSAHNWGCAADFCFTEGDPYRGHAEEWAEFGALASQAGLVWGGDFTKLNDMPHVELPTWREIRKQGWKPKETA